MELVNVRDLFRRQDEYVDQTIAIGGWVRNIRNSKNFGFIVVNDGTFFEPVQVGSNQVISDEIGQPDPLVGSFISFPILFIQQIFDKYKGESLR